MWTKLKYWCDFLNGTAISTGNGENHEVSAAAWHSCSTAEPTAAFTVMLSIWALHAACLGGILRYNSFNVIFPRKLCLRLFRKILNLLLLWLLGGSFYLTLFRNLPYVLEIMIISTEILEMFFMRPRLQDLLGTPGPEQTQTRQLEQCKRKGDWWAPTDQEIWLQIKGLLLHYVQNLLNK